MISVHIDGDSATDVREQMMQMLGVKLASGATAAIPAAPLAAVNQPETPASDKADVPKPLTAAQKRAAAKAEADAAAAARAISSGGERTDPAVDAQDAKDEAGETAGAKAETKKLTHDDVRGALGEYVKKFGMPAAQEDGPKVLVLMFGEGKAKVSDIPDDQVALAKAVAGIQEMSEKNPFKRTEAEKAA